MDEILGDNTIPLPFSKKSLKMDKNTANYIRKPKVILYLKWVFGAYFASKIAKHSIQTQLNKPVYDVSIQAFHILNLDLELFYISS